MKKKLLLFIFLAALLSGCGSQTLSLPSSQTTESLTPSQTVSETCSPESSIVPAVSVSTEPAMVPLTAENEVFATLEPTPSGKALKASNRIGGYIGDIGENQLFVSYETESARYLFLARIEGNRYLKKALVQVPYLVKAKIAGDKILALCKSCYFVFDKDLASFQRYEFPVEIVQDLYSRTYDVSGDLKKLVYRDPNQDLLLYDMDTKEKRLLLKFADYVHDINNSGCSCFEAPRFVADDQKIAVCFIHYADTMDVLLYDLSSGQTVSTYVGSAAPSSTMNSPRGYAWLGRNKEHDTQTVSFLNYETGQVSEYDTGLPWNSMPLLDSTMGFVSSRYAVVYTIKFKKMGSSEIAGNQVYLIDLSASEFKPQPLTLDAKWRVTLRYIFDSGQICYIAMTEDGNFGDYYITQ